MGHLQLIQGPRVRGTKSCPSRSASLEETLFTLAVQMVASGSIPARREAEKLLLGTEMSSSRTVLFHDTALDHHAENHQ